MYRAPPHRYPTFNVEHFRLDPNEVVELPGVQTPVSVESYHIAGGRRGVINHDSGHTYKHGTWNKKKPNKLYSSVYLPGAHTLEAGPKGLEYLCINMLHPNEPIEVELVEVDGGFTLTAPGFVADGSVRLGDRTLERFGYLAPGDVGSVVTGKADLILVRPKA